ncbi:superfamily I DNA and/or RNA helicase [Peribacillus cavernae]|nr:superfamily I DNA and/or RNA helicase [Peribacillus cavernae]
MFEYKRKPYLVGLVTQLKEVRYFKVQKISTVATMPIYSQPPLISFDQLIKEQNAFAASDCSLADVYDKEWVLRLQNLLEEKETQKDSKVQRLMEYYVNALKSEQLSDLEIDLNDHDFFHALAGAHCLELVEIQGSEYTLDSKFASEYVHWDKQLKRQPELSIHLGYPLQKAGTKKYVPILYFETIYNIENNSIKLKNNNPYINVKFMDEYTNFTEEDAKAYASDVLSNIKTLKDRSGKPNGLVDGGILFLHKSAVSQVKFLKELQDIGNKPNRKYLAPLKKIVETNFGIPKRPTYENVYSIVPMNMNQQDSVKHSTNDITLIQGPPGTGKTQTILNLIANAVIRGEKVLVASTNNKAVDNVYEKLIKKELFKGTLRVGNAKFREDAVKVIAKELKDIPKQPEEDMMELTEKSETLSKIIEEIQRKLHRIEEIRTMLKDVASSQMYLEGLLTENVVSISDFQMLIGIMESDYRTLDSQLNFLQALSAKISQKTTQTQKGFWKLLSSIGVQVETIFTNKYRKRISKLGVRNTYLLPYQKLESFHIELQNYISAIQYRMLGLKKDSLVEELQSYDEAKLKHDFTINQEKKCGTDKKILSVYDVKRQQLFPQEDKDFLAAKLSPVSYSSSENRPSKEKREFSFSDSTYFDKIIKLFPVYLCTNQSVPSCVPFDFEFDLVIIDEASQCTIPASLPAVKRAKRLVVVGDNLQLNPVVTVDENFDKNLLEKYQLHHERNSRKQPLYLFKNQSLFDVFDDTLEDPFRFFLNEHFRCHPDIIQFSNIHFYQRLKIMTKNSEGPIKGFVTLDVDTTNLTIDFSKKKYVNQYEFKRIIHFIDYHFNDIKHLSVGIITPLTKQKQFIIDSVKQLAETVEDDEKQQFYKRLIQEDGIGTVHTFQGGERDIIFFSTVISPGINPKVVKWMNQNTTLINVAVTRAIQAFIIVADLKYLGQAGGILKDLSLYAQKKGTPIETRDMKSVYQVTKSIYKQKNNPHVKELLNKGEQYFYDVLHQTIEKQYPDLKINFQMRVCDVIKIEKGNLSYEMYSFALRSHFDFILYIEDTYEPVAAFEYDGWYHRNDPKTISNDKKKDSLCENADFTLIRIPSTAKLSEQYLFAKLSPYLEEGETS